MLSLLRILPHRGRASQSQDWQMFLTNVFCVRNAFAYILPLRCTDLYNDTSQLLFLVYFKSVVMEFRTKPHSFCWYTRIQLKPCLLRGNLHVHPYSETPSSTLPSASSETVGTWHSIFEGSNISEEWNAPYTVFSAWKWNNTIIKTVICYHKDVKAKKRNTARTAELSWPGMCVIS